MPAFFSFSLEESFETSLPFTWMLPAITVAKPKIECSTVDLPAPFGPIRQSDWPLPTRSEKSCRISICP